MNSQQLTSDPRVRWWQLPWILCVYIAFAVLATAWGTYGSDIVPDLYESSLRFTGWSALSVYSFTLIVVLGAVLNQITRRRSRNLIAGLLIFTALFDLWDVYDHTWGTRAGATDYGNPYLAYSPWRAVFTVVIPLFWSALLYLPSMNRWVKDRSKSDWLFRTIFVRLMGPFMPGRIVIVDGRHDQLFLQSLFRARLSKQKITVASVTPTRSYANLEKELVKTRDYFGDLQSAPFQDRIFFVFEPQNTEIHKRFLEIGINENRTEVLSTNGIEHYYPRSIMKSIFQCADEDLKRMNVDGDEIEINGIRKTKDELSKVVCSEMTGETSIQDELQKLVAKLSKSD